MIPACEARPLHYLDKCDGKDFKICAQQSISNHLPGGNFALNSANMETSPIFKEGGGNQFFMYTWISFLAQRNEKMHFFFKFGWLLIFNF